MEVSRESYSDIARMTDSNMDFLDGQGVFEKHLDIINYKFVID